MKTKAYDLIGDIHGHHEKLTALLSRLGYKPHGESYRHPEGRKVIFLGDYIDRGPKIREVLHTVRAMVDAGDALAIMGNHEFNAVCYHTPDGKGNWLRERGESKKGQQNETQHKETVLAFKGKDEEWEVWLNWIKRLPMHLDLGVLRVVHACWDARHLEMLSDTPLLDPQFLRAAATKDTAEFAAVEVMLKGPELNLPDGISYPDKEGIKRTRVRVRWWNLEEGAAIGDLAMPEPMAGLNHKVDNKRLRDLPNYAADEPPVFFGHYWLPADRAKAPLARNLASLDYSGAFEDNPLTAYRWDGERELSADKFVTTPTV